MVLFTSNDRPILMDVGGNVGQTVTKFRQIFPNGTIHSFEPGPTAFGQLLQNCGELPGVKLWNCAVGAQPGRTTLFENTATEMSSILPLSVQGWGEVARSPEVDVISLDLFAMENKIEFVDILKSDTQGFEDQVFAGADRLLREGRIGLIYFEVILSDMYEGLPTLDRLFGCLREHNYRLVAFYDVYYQDHLTGWTDVLFIHSSLYSAWKERLKS